LQLLGEKFGITNIKKICQKESQLKKTFISYITMPYRLAALLDTANKDFGIATYTFHPVIPLFGLIKRKKKIVLTHDQSVPQE